MTAADLMSIAAFYNNKYAVSFPSFGSERMGAPVAAFVRIDQREIELREPVLRPNLLIVLDPTLFQAVDVFAGLAPDGWVMVNSRKSPEELGLGPTASRLPAGRLRCVPGTDVALKHLKLPKPNVVLVGAAAALLPDLLTQQALEGAVREVFSHRIAEMNIAAAREAAEIVRGQRAKSREVCAC